MRKDFEPTIGHSISWQLVTYGQGHCRGSAEHRVSVFLAFFLRFPSIAASIRLHNMHGLS